MADRSSQVSDQPSPGGSRAAVSREDKQAESAVVTGAAQLTRKECSRPHLRAWPTQGGAAGTGPRG